MRRVDQRDLRRGAAIRAARLRRTGLERRGSAQDPGPDARGLERGHHGCKRGRRIGGLICLRILDLTTLGWGPALIDAFEPHAAKGLVPARVALEHTHIYRVLSADGEWLARVSGRLRHAADQRADFPAVGDWVAVEPSAQDGDARIQAVLPRFSRFSRRAAGDPTEEQIVAANINTVFLVAGLDRDFNLRRLERYLLVARDSGATPVIVLNKADLVDDPSPFVEEVRSLDPQVAIHS